MTSVPPSTLPSTKSVDERLDRVVDPLEHRGHDHGLEGRVVDGVVLVGVDADRATARAAAAASKTPVTRTAGRVVDDVGAGLEHALRDDLAAGRVAEAGEVTGRARCTG